MVLDRSTHFCLLMSTTDLHQLFCVSSPHICLCYSPCKLASTYSLTQGSNVTSALNFFLTVHHDTSIPDLLVETLSFSSGFTNRGKDNILYNILQQIQYIIIICSHYCIHYKTRGFKRAKTMICSSPSKVGSE